MLDPYRLLHWLVTICLFISSAAFITSIPILILTSMVFKVDPTGYIVFAASSGAATLCLRIIGAMTARLSGIE